MRWRQTSPMDQKAQFIAEVLGFDLESNLLSNGSLSGKVLAHP